MVGDTPHEGPSSSVRVRPSAGHFWHSDLANGFSDLCFNAFAAYDAQMIAESVTFADANMACQRLGSAACHVVDALAEEYIVDSNYVGSLALALDQSCREPLRSKCVPFAVCNCRISHFG